MWCVREFFYIQMEKYARQALSDGVKSTDELIVTNDSEIFRVLILHYNRNNQIEVRQFSCSVYSAKKTAKVVHDQNWSTGVHSIHQYCYIIIIRRNSVAFAKSSRLQRTRTGRSATRGLRQNNHVARSHLFTSHLNSEALSKTVSWQLDKFDRGFKGLSSSICFDRIEYNAIISCYFREIDKKNPTFGSLAAALTWLSWHRVLILWYGSPPGRLHVFRKLLCACAAKKDKRRFILLSAAPWCPWMSHGRWSKGAPQRRWRHS